MDKRPFGGRSILNPKVPKRRRAAALPKLTEIEPDANFSVYNSKDPLRGAMQTSGAAQSTIGALRDAATKKKRGPDIEGMLQSFNDLSKDAGGGDDTGGGGSTVPGAGDAWKGFAGRYVPGERDLLFSNPRIIVDDWLAQGAYKNNPQMAGDLGRYADIVFGNQNVGGLFELLNRGDIGADVNFGDDDQINYLVDLLREQSTVGGKSPTVRQMLNALFEGFGDEDSSMGGMLTDGEGNPVPTQAAIGALMQFIPLLGEFTGNIRYSNAMRRQANRLAQDYMGAQAKGKNKGTFLDYLKQNFLT